MKNIRKTFISILCLLTSLIALASFCLMGGCTGTPSNSSQSSNQNNGGNNDQRPDVQASISFNVLEKTLIVGNEEYLSPEYKRLDGYTLTYSSSDPETVSVNNQGKISAGKEGFATITATYSNGSDSAEASLTVSTTFGGYLPELKTMGVADEISIAVNSSYQVLPYVAFNGKQFNDVTVNYYIVDTAVAQVSESGEITANGKGTTQLVLEAAWRGKTVSDTLTLQKVIELSVIDDVRFFNDGELVADEVLYTFASFEGKSYKNSIPANFSVLVNGVESDAQFTIENENVVKKQGDSIVVTGYGETNVVIQSTTSEGTFSKTFAITVNRVEKTVSSIVPLFSTTEGSYLNVESGETHDILEFVNDGDDIVDAFQGNRPLTISGRKVLGVESSSQVARGNANIKVGTDKIVYYFTLETLAKAISTKEDIKSLQLEDGKILTGYYELINNIDAAGISITHVQSNNACFSGVFDGKGHTIENLTLAQPANGTFASGLFGVLNSTAIVKNFALVNLDATKVYFLASNTLNDGLTISNVYISISASTATPRGLTGRTGASSVWTNIVIEYLGDNAEATRSYAERWNWQGLIGGLWTYESNGMLYAQDKKWSDVYVISPFLVSFRTDEKKDGANFAALYGYGANETTDIYGNAITSITNNRENPNLGDYWQTTLYYNAKFTNLYHYSSYEALQAARRDFSSFSSDYWVVSNNQVIWKSLFTKNLEVKFYDGQTDLGSDAKLVGLNSELSVKAFADGNEFRNVDVEVEANDYVVYNEANNTIKLVNLPAEGAVSVNVNVTVSVGGTLVHKTVSIMAMGDLINVEKVYDLVDEKTGLLAGGAFPMSEIVGNEQVLSIYQGGNRVAYNAETGALSGLTANIVGSGEEREVLPVELTINTRGKVYIVNVKVYSMVINTVKDLQYFNQSLAGNENNTYNGYYILTKNLSDFSSVYNNVADSNHNLTPFTGTFDGNGHTISAKVNKGFFGVLGNGAVVKNVALTNMQVMVDDAYTMTAILAGYINNSTDVVVVKDVYISMDESLGADTYRKYMSKWFTTGILVSNNASIKSKFANIVIEANIYHSTYNSAADGAGAQPCLFRYWNAVDEAGLKTGQYSTGTAVDALSNVYVISKDMTNMGGLFRITAGIGRTNKGMVLSYNDYMVVAGGNDPYANNYLPSTYNNGTSDIVTMRRYDDYNAMAQDKNDYSLFNSNCWILTGSTPVWKNK